MFVMTNNDNSNNNSNNSLLTKQDVLEMMKDIGDKINYTLLIKEKIVALFKKFDIHWYDLVYYSPEQAYLQYQKETGASPKEALNIVIDYLQFKQN